MNPNRGLVSISDYLHNNAWSLNFRRQYIMLFNQSTPDNVFLLFVGIMVPTHTDPVQPSKAV